MDEYPSTAYIITLIGGILSFIFGLVFIFASAAIIVETGIPIGSVCLVLSFISATLGILAALLMKNPQKVHTGGILAIIAAFMTGWGVITFILLLIGGIMALTWKPPEKKAVILPPPPPR